jgi:uncharacterized protein
MAAGKDPLVQRPLFWRLWVIVLAVTLLAQLAVLWKGGEAETTRAFAEGRRLLVTLVSGEVEGKRLSSEGLLAPAPAPEISAEVPPDAAPETPPEKPTEATDAPVAAAPQTPTAETPETTPAATEAPATPEAAVKPEEVIQTIETISSEIAEEPLPAVAPSISAPRQVQPALVEKADIGSLPRISGDGSKPWKEYSKPFIRKGNNPMIAIIVTDLGLTKRSAELAIRLPEPVTLSFSPYTPDLSSWVASARLAGHELLLDLPMEPVNYPARDPGPLALMVTRDQPGNEMRLKKTMTTATGYMGFMMPQNEVFSSNNELFKSLIGVLSGRGLMLVVGKPPHKSETKEMLETGSLAHVVADTLIDEELTEAGIGARLTLLEQTAKQNGYAVGVARGYPLTLKELKQWAEKLEENGFTLVPVSIIIGQRYS